MFITFDGPHGVGKTTIVDAVRHELIMAGVVERLFDLVITKEPTNCSVGKLLKENESWYAGKALACIAAADRHWHIEHQVRPDLARGKLVISDRYVESSLVLQRLDGCSLDYIWSLHEGILVPDLSIILLARPWVLAKRLEERGKRQVLNRFESRKENREKAPGFYRDAGEFLQKKGFNVSYFSNESRSIEKLAKRIARRIQKLHQEKSAEG